MAFFWGMSLYLLSWPLRSGGRWVFQQTTLRSGKNFLRAVQQAEELFRELQETLESGWVPEPELWNRLSKLQDPWKSLSEESLLVLRRQGGALLPTLRRLNQLARDQKAHWDSARARAAQAVLQCVVCTTLAPLFSLGLFQFLPGLENEVGAWSLVTLLATGWSAMGGLWLFHLAEKARNGGLASNQRDWVLSSQCAVERFLAALRGGDPPDLAWSRALDFLDRSDRNLATLWGRSPWSDSLQKNEPSVKQSSAAHLSLIQLSEHLRKAVHLSVLEGKSCQERVDVALQTFEKEWGSHVEKELSLLGTRALKPLFICVAPSLFSLLVLGMILGWNADFSGV